MKVPRTRISDTIAQKTLSSGVTKQLSKEVAAYLLSTKRTEELNSIMRDVQADWAKKGIIDVDAVSAFPISSEVRKDIIAAVRKIYPNSKKINITAQHDPKIVGGVRLELANSQLDLSIQSKLNKFKQLAVSGKA